MVQRHAAGNADRKTLRKTCASNQNKYCEPHANAHASSLPKLKSCPLVLLVVPFVRLRRGRLIFVGSAGAFVMFLPGRVRRFDLFQALQLVK